MIERLAKIFANHKQVNHLDVGIHEDEIEGFLEIWNLRIPILFTEVTTETKQFVDTELDKLQHYLVSSPCFKDLEKITKSYEAITKFENHFKEGTIEELEKFTLKVYVFFESFGYEAYHDPLTEEILFEERLQTKYIGIDVLNRFIHTLFLQISEPYLESVYLIYDEIHERVLKEDGFIQCRNRVKYKIYDLLGITYLTYDVEYSMNDKASYLTRLFANMFLKLDYVNQDFFANPKYKGYLEDIKQRIPKEELKKYVKNTIYLKDEDDWIKIAEILQNNLYK